MDILDDIKTNSVANSKKTAARTVGESNKRRRRGDGPRHGKIPGGAIKSDTRIQDCLPNELSFRIRAYLDVLLGATSIEKLRLATMRFYSGGASASASSVNDRNSRDSLYAIPTIVDAILKYNNIVFGSVTLYKTKADLIEPIWYDVDLPNNALRLFTNVDSRLFVRQITDFPVVMASGIIPIERYNPYVTNPMIDNIDAATIHCAVTCDHVAQHIIDEVLSDEPRIDGADVHDQFGKYGTTLHSMFDITIMGDRCETHNETSRLVTIFDARDKPLRDIGGGGGSLNPY